MKTKINYDETEKTLIELEEKYGYPSCEVFYSYKSKDKLNIPKEDLIKWVHTYIIHNKNKMEVR